MSHDRNEPARTRTMPAASELVVGAALGCSMAWVSMSFKSLGMFASWGHSEQLLDAVYLASIISVSLTLVLAGTFDRWTGAFLVSRTSLFVLPLGVTASTLAMPLGGTEGWAGTALICLAGASSGIFSGLFLVRFGMVFSRLLVRSIVTAAATASVLSTLLFILFLLFSPFEACVFAASMPLLAAMLLEFGKKGLELPQQDDACPLTQQVPLEDAQERTDWGHLTAKLALCSLLVGFANEAARTLYVQMGIAGSSGPAYAFIEAIAAFGTTAGVIGVALGLLNSKSEHMAKNSYYALVLLLVGGVLLLPAPLIYPSIDVSVPHALNAAGYTCFGMFMWVIVAAVCGRYQQVRIRTFAYVRAAWALGPLAGMLVGRYVLHVAGLSVETTFPVMLVAALTLLAVSGLVFSESDLAKAMDIMPLERKRRFRSKCLKVVERYGLSEREGEIMVMFAKGRNLPYVQEHLYLSKSTVSTHRQHIYQKLGIHSQQELINLVQETE